MLLMLYDRDYNVIATVESTASSSASLRYVMWGTRGFAPDAIRRFVEVTSVDQAVYMPANIPPPAVGAVN